MADDVGSNDPIGSFGDRLRRILTDPRGFFESLKLESGIGPATTFAAICLAIGGFEFLLFGGGLKGAVGFVLFGLVRLFLGAAIATLVAENVFEGKGDYEATFRVLAYSTAVAVVFGLPVVNVVAAIYGAYLVIIGLERAHGFDAVRSVLTVIITAVVSGALVYALGLSGLAARVNPLFG